MLTVILTLQPYITSSDITVPIYTDSLTVINHCKQETLNTPSYNMADNIDIMLQIRHVITKIKFHIQFIRTHSSKIDDEYDPTPEEKLLLSRRELATKYYTTAEAQFPSQIPLQFPELIISLRSQGNTMIHDFLAFLQHSERYDSVKEYFHSRPQIHPLSIPHLDRYTLRSIMQRTPSHRDIYSKIIHMQLNTMKINFQWGTSTTPNCPVCRQTPEI